MNIFKKAGFHGLLCIALVVTDACAVDSSGFKDQLRAWGALDHLASDEKVVSIDDFLRERDRLLNKLEHRSYLGLKAIFERYDMYQYSDDLYGEESAFRALEKSEDFQAKVILKVLELDRESSPYWSGGTQVTPCEITLADHPVRVLQALSQDSLLASCVLSMLYDTQFHELESDEWAKRNLVKAKEKKEELDRLCDEHEDSNLSRGWVCLRSLLERIVASYPKDLSVARYSFEEEKDKEGEGAADFE